MNFADKTAVIWDLDGTLTDPADGITRSVQAALAHFGLSAPGKSCFPSSARP